MDIPLNSRFQITRRSNPTTGYGWEVTVPEGIALTGQHYLRSGNTGAVGGGGNEIFTFEAQKAGNFEIILDYRRVWEKESDEGKETLKVFVHN